MKRTLYIILLFGIIATFLTGCSVKKESNVAGCHSEKISHEAPFWSRLFYTTYSAEKKENICMSPLSAQLALAMTSTGAEGKTREQIENTIKFDNTYNLIKELKEGATECEIKLANSIWINNRLNVKEEFIDSNKKDFDAEVRTIPFDNDAVNIINEWCKENTNGKINSIINKIEPFNMMFLLNALYFKAPWLTPFNKSYTAKEVFTKEDGKRVEVDMMKQTFTTAYYSDDVVQIASKPFKERYDMLFVLPADNKSIDDAIRHLACNYNSCMDSMKQSRIEFSLPKFKSEYETSLKNALYTMGIKKAFSEEAEFDGISKTPLYIDNVIQKTFINIDEEGAEAAAVTAVSMNMMSMRPQEKITMRLDHPFLYAIRDGKRDTILFIGKVGNPNEL